MTIDLDPDHGNAMLDLELKYRNDSQVLLLLDHIKTNQDEIRAGENIIGERQDSLHTINNNVCDVETLLDGIEDLIDELPTAKTKADRQSSKDAIENELEKIRKIMQTISAHSEEQ